MARLRINRQNFIGITKSNGRNVMLMVTQPENDIIIENLMTRKKAAIAPEKAMRFLLRWEIFYCFDEVDAI